MRIFYQIKGIVLGLFLLVFLLFPVALITVPFALDRRLKIICPAWQLFARGLLRFVTMSPVDIRKDFRSEELKTTPAYGLFIANHQSYIDIPLILSTFQVPPIMKKQVLYIPIFGWIGWVSGAMAVSRSSVHSRKKVFEQTKKRILEDRIGIQVYPEGTRSKNAEPKPVNEIKKPLLAFAFNENIPVIPVSLYGTRGVLNKFGFLNPHRHLGIIVHKEIYPKEFKNEDEFINYCWGKVISGHSELKTQLAPLNKN